MSWPGAKSEPLRSAGNTATAEAGAPRRNKQLRLRRRFDAVWNAAVHLTGAKSDRSAIATRTETAEAHGLR
jgi:hypothetical protein